VKEFPSGPAGYEILGEVAESADLAKMRELADLMPTAAGRRIDGRGQRFVAPAGRCRKIVAIEFTATDGREVNLTTLSNKVVLVDFWATWCPHCVEMVPNLKNFTISFMQTDLKLSASTSTTKQIWRNDSSKEKDLAWPQFFGGRDNKYGKNYALNFLPSAWLVDRKGIVRDIHGTADLEAKVEKLMAK